MRGEQIIVVPGASARDYRTGNVLPAGPERVIDGVAVVPRGTAEAANFSSTVLEGLTLYMPRGARVDPSDKVWVRGSLYAVTGEPGVWRSPYTGNEAGVQVAVDRVEG